ncbi:hypothetical protein B0J11DRAFT_520039 [Dendryphion nanum]|uniref:DUF7580 domain-containing protein n=1 Tax=Dendryphion nanum TaxID=256645 RepID=A0A9P9EFF9_9PLEO|nr:hypothetical protein B0J11DRAFT_520039 [Dendryphion nanum]
MVSGIECAGLALATLPLFIEAGKVYASGTEALADIMIASRRDQKLENFYEQFWWETVELSQKLKQIINALPNLTPARKVELATAANLEHWTLNDDVKAALQTYFADDNDFNTFERVVTKLVSLLGQLVKDSTIHISTKDADQVEMYSKLKQFASDRESQQTTSRFRERLAFWKKEKHREKCLKELQLWNKRLGRLIQKAPSGVLATTTTTQSNATTQVGLKLRGIPSIRLRQLSQLLYRTLSLYWDCCTVRHEAKVCLKLHDEGSTNYDESAEFSFLVSYDLKKQNQCTWQEGYVIVRSGCPNTIDDREELAKICDAFQTTLSNQQLRLLVEDLNSCQKLWRLRSQPRSLQILDRIPATSLDSLIRGRTNISLRNKRRLALILSHSLLQYHDSEWLSSEWGKRHISFLYSAQDTPDLERPYLSTCFDKCHTAAKPDLTRFHRNPSILALGILLIEIELGKPIEQYRIATDDVNVNTDMIVADRIALSMNQCSEPYRQAIRACLDVPWVSAGRKVSLEDEDTRDGLYRSVICPLEKELEYMFPKP